MILAVYGASGLGTEHYMMAKRLNENQYRWTKIFFVDDTPEKEGKTLEGAPIITFQQAMEEYGKENLEFVIAVGEPIGKDKLYKKLKQNGCRLATMLAPDIYVPESATLGEGVIIKENCWVPPTSVFGNNVMLQRSALVGHGTVLGDNVVISSFGFVGGLTQIGKNSYIGPHACVRDRVKIGENVIVGMGAVVTKDIPDNAVVYGNPAKIVRYNETGKIFKG